MRQFVIRVSEKHFELLVKMALAEYRNYRGQAGWLVERAVDEWWARQKGPPPDDVTRQQS